MVVYKKVNQKNTKIFQNENINAISGKNFIIIKTKLIFVCNAKSYNSAILL